MRLKTPRGCQLISWIDASWTECMVHGAWGKGGGGPFVRTAPVTPLVGVEGE